MFIPTWIIILILSVYLIGRTLNALVYFQFKKLFYKYTGKRMSKFDSEFIIGRKRIRLYKNEDGIITSEIVK